MPVSFPRPNVPPVQAPSLKAQLQRAADLRQKGDLAAAAQHYAAILGARPNQPDALFFLGLMAFERDSYPICAELSGKAIAAGLKQNIPQAHYIQGSSLLALGRLDEALASLRKLLRIDRNHQLGHRNIALTYFSLGQLSEAVEHLKKAVTLQSGDALSWGDLGAAYFALGRVEEAEAAYRRALALRPDLGRTRYNLGSALQALGRFDDAVAVYADMIAAQPDHAQAYLRYTQCRKMIEADLPTLARLESLSELPHADPQNRINAHYALGKLHDDLQHYDQAFGHYREANRLERADKPFDRQQLVDEIDAQIATFTAEFFALHEGLGLPADSTPTPIFIIGMPRSGTTLLDQILSSHSQVESAGEQNFWTSRAALPAGQEIASFSKGKVQQLARDYLDFMRPLVPSSQSLRYVIDKLPHNFLRLGLIRLCFPGARFIHCKRDPLDTCLSMFFQKFVASHPYANDLDDLAFVYRQYLRLMAHWQAVFPQAILDVQYEDVVADPLAQSRRMLAFCGLEWEEACANLTGNKRAVMTASNWQVRQPINNKAVARWRHYREHLAALNGLGSSTAT